MKFKIAFQISIILLFTFTLILPVQAIVLTPYSDRSAWESALDSWDLIDFNGITTGTSLVSPSYTIDGVTFSVSSGELYLVESIGSDASYLTSGYLEWQNASPNTMTVSLPNDVDALAFDFGEFRGGIRQFDIEIGGITNTVYSASNQYSFFGVTSDVSFDAFNLHITADNFPIIDNFSFAQSGFSAVPEPTTMLLLGTGLICLTGVRRKAGKQN